MQNRKSKGIDPGRGVQKGGNSSGRGEVSVCVFFDLRGGENRGV